MGDEGRHRSTSRPVVAIGIGVAVAVLAGAVFALTRGGAGTGSDEPLAVDFEIGRANGISSLADVPNREYDDDAARIAGNLAAFFSRFYEQGFLVAANNGAAEYGAALGSFAPEALEDARAQLQVLTLGDLGPTFSSVAPLPGTIRVRVLFDADGAAMLAVASVFFQATATPADGSTPVTIASGGEFFLEPDASAWKIVAFSVNRNDSTAPAPTGAAS